MYGAGIVKFIGAILSSCSIS